MPRDATFVMQNETNAQTVYVVCCAVYFKLNGIKPKFYFEYNNIYVRLVGEVCVSVNVWKKKLPCVAHFDHKYFLYP